MLQALKLAYRRLARLYHPDMKNSERAKAAMQAVNLSYQNFQTFVNVQK
jgi:DnaJ-class molecular chaperone